MTYTRKPWNKNKSVGQKKGFTPMQIKELRSIFKKEKLIFDDALFSFALDTILRSSDIIKMKVEDVVDWKGNVKDTINLRQQKTSKGQKVILSPRTQEALQTMIQKEKKFENDYLFVGKTKYGTNRKNHISRVTYSKFVKKWAKMLGLDPYEYATHSLRRTIPSIIYRHERQEKGFESILEVKEMLGHSSVESTLAYLNVKQEEALETRKKWMI